MSCRKAVIATIDPFDPNAKGACLPTGSCTSSYRASAVIRVDTTLGDDGTMVVFANPSPANDAVCLWYTDGGSSNTSFDHSFSCNSNAAILASNTDGTITGTFTKTNLSTRAASALPFESTAILGNGNDPTELPAVRARVVSCGVKVTFTGATLSDGGVFYSLIEPTHDSLFQLGQDTLSQYTSTKVQRGCLRKEIELNMFPVTRAQMEFSNAYDECQVNDSVGLLRVVDGNDHIIGTLSGYGSPVPGWSAAAGVTPCTPVMDGVKTSRAALSLLYPLSRRNHPVTGFRTGPSTAGNTMSINASPNALSFAGTPSTVSQLLNGFALMPTTTKQPCLINNTGAALLAEAMPGVYSSLNPIVAETYNLQGLMAAPAVYGGILINAGTGMAGQSVHIEYICHVEYTGLSVQGRTQPIVPSEETLHLVHAVVDHAREVSGQNEHMDMRESAIQAMEKYAEIAAPSAVAVVADSLAPGTGQLAAKGVHLLLSAVKAHHRKRKLN